jgi:hypothetical protein
VESSQKYEFKYEGSGKVTVIDPVTGEGLYVEVGGRLYTPYPNPRLSPEQYKEMRRAAASHLSRRRKPQVQRELRLSPSTKRRRPE